MDGAAGSGQVAVGRDLIDQARSLAQQVESLPVDDRVKVLNEIRSILHEVSPFRDEPVDLVLWVPAESAEANDYNPNVVAPPEMKLLQRSIEADGYTQPVVTWVEDGRREVVDGFHRNRIARECPVVRGRLKGYLPVTTIKEDRSDRGDRVASTIRHNRARGKHLVAEMSNIVMELSRRNWSPEKIGRELGMEPDEVLRLKQITGLADLFADRDFSEAWD